jgi:hypothetical protein
MSLRTTVLDPCGSRSPRVHRLPMRPRTLDGLQVAFLDNRKPNADIFLDQVAAQLARRFGLRSMIRLSKHTPTGAAGEEVYARLQQADLVLLALGDCAGCAAWSVHDAVELERRGVPTVSFVSEVFVGMAESQARMRGLPALPLVRLPHPFGQLAPERVRDSADDAIDRIVEVGTRVEPALAAHG